MEDMVLEDMVLEDMVLEDSPEDTVDGEKVSVNCSDLMVLLLFIYSMAKGASVLQNKFLIIL